MHNYSSSADQHPSSLESAFQTALDASTVAHHLGPVNREIHKNPCFQVDFAGAAFGISQIYLFISDRFGLVSATLFNTV